MPTNHALLAPSAAKRWMKCAPSAVAESGCPQQETSYAKEGTIAHAVGEFFLTLSRDLGELAEPSEKTSEHLRDLESQAKELGVDFDEMVSTVFEYYVTPVFEDYLQARAEDANAQLLIESQLNLKTFIPEGFGSSDAVIIYRDVLHVYDLKYGRGVRVEAKQNEQMRCYALGALYGAAELYGINEIHMTILQPRLQHCSSDAMSYDELVNWGIYILRPAAERAFKGLGEYVPGDHCKFCRFAPRCRASFLRAKVTAEIYGEPEALSFEEIGEALKNVESIKTWASRIEEYALQQTLMGNTIPGWKAVESRSIRKITDVKGCTDALLDAGFERDMITKAPELKTISDLEKMLGKAGKALIAPFITKPQGKPTLAPESDPRQAFAGAKSDFE